MRHPVDILTDRLLDRFMRVCDTFIAAMIVGINDCIITRLVNNKALQRGRIADLMTFTLT